MTNRWDGVTRCDHVECLVSCQLPLLEPLVYETSKEHDRFGAKVKARAVTPDAKNDKQNVFVSEFSNKIKLAGPSRSNGPS